jgi:hypothetical protein
MSGQDPLEQDDEKSVLDFLQTNQPKIIEVQMYLSKAPIIKIEKHVEVQFAASILVDSNDHPHGYHEDLLLSIRKDSIYIEAIGSDSETESSNTVAEVFFDNCPECHAPINQNDFGNCETCKKEMICSSCVTKHKNLNHKAYIIEE